MAVLRDEQVRTKVLEEGWEKGKVVVTPEQAGVKRIGKVKDRKDMLPPV